MRLELLRIAFWLKGIEAEDAEDLQHSCDVAFGK
jgi:hypothetical protein